MVGKIDNMTEFATFSKLTHVTTQAWSDTDSTTLTEKGSTVCAQLTKQRDQATAAIDVMASVAAIADPMSQTIERQPGFMSFALAAAKKANLHIHKTADTMLRLMPQILTYSMFAS